MYLRVGFLGGSQDGGWVWGLVSGNLLATVLLAVTKDTIFPK